MKAKTSAVSLKNRLDHVHNYRPIGEPWRVEKRVPRLITYTTSRGRVSKKRTFQMQRGHLVQTVYCNGCTDRREVMIKPEMGR